MNDLISPAGQRLQRALAWRRRIGQIQHLITTLDAEITAEVAAARDALLEEQRVEDEQPTPNPVGVRR